MLDALISAGANLLGGLFNRSQQQDFNRQQMQLAQQQMDMQREFAQHGIQWKVADAQAAGIHPLAALGAQTSSPSPVSVGGSAPTMDFGSLGQDLGRAAKAMQTESVRAAVDEREARKLSLEKAGLENDILRQELNSKVMRTSRLSGQLGPPLGAPSDGGVPAGALAHLSRSPQRAPHGEALGDKKQEQNEAPATEYRWHRPYGYWLRVNPYFDDGQTTQNRFGESEIGETIKYGANVIGDHIATVPHLADYLWKRYKRYQSGYSGY